MNRNTVVHNHFRKSDPKIFSLIEKFDLPGLHPKSDHFFSSVCEIIINQQLSDKAASTIFHKFKSLFQDGLITPDKLLKLSEEEIRLTGPSKNKISFMKGLAQKVITQEIDLNGLDKLGDDEVKKELIKIKGIGNWSADMFLLVALGREDVFSPGDLGLRKAIQKLYGLKKEPTVKQMEKISKKWMPYRTYASRLLWKSLEI